MPRLHLAALVVAFLLRRNARTTILDLLARVSVLEGIAGKRPGTWMRHVEPVTQFKGGYTQIKSKWRTDTGVTVEARFHGPTPGAPAGSAANWRVTHTFPGTPTGLRKETEHLVRRPDETLDWVSNQTWYDAQNAYSAGTATQAQRELLRGGHH